MQTHKQTRTSAHSEARSEAQGYVFLWHDDKTQKPAIRLGGQGRFADTVYNIVFRFLSDSAFASDLNSRIQTAISIYPNEKWKGTASESKISKALASCLGRLIDGVDLPLRAGPVFVANTPSPLSLPSHYEACNTNQMQASLNSPGIEAGVLEGLIVPKLPQEVLDQVKSINAELDQLQQPVLARLQIYLDSLRGTSFGSYEANTEFAREIQKLLRRLNAKAVLASSPDAEAGGFVCKKGNSRTGAFGIDVSPAEGRSCQAKSGRTTYGGSTTIPELRLILPAPE